MTLQKGVNDRYHALQREFELLQYANKFIEFLEYDLLGILNNDSVGNDQIFLAETSDFAISGRMFDPFLGEIPESDFWEVTRFGPYNK